MISSAALTKKAITWLLLKVSKWQPLLALHSGEKETQFLIFNLLGLNINCMQLMNNGVTFPLMMLGPL